MSKSSFFYQAETFQGCGKFKKSTGSQSFSVVAPRMANILTSENFVKSVGGQPKLFWATHYLVARRYCSRPYCRESKRGEVTKIVQMSNSLSLKQSYWTFSFRITQFLYQKATLSPILLRILTKAALIVGCCKITNSAFIQSQLYNLITNLFIYF